MSRFLFGEEVMEAICLIYEDKEADLFRNLHNANLDFGIGDIADMTLKFRIDEQTLKAILERLDEAREIVANRFGKTEGPQRQFISKVKETSDASS